MYNLTQVPDDNLGGVAALYYTDQSDVLAVPEESGLVLQGNISLKPGSFWYKLEATFNTRSFKEDPKTDRHGIIFNQQLKGFKPKDSAQLAHALNDLRHRRLAYLYRDQNGITRYVPNAEFQASFDTETVGGRNGYDFSLRSENRDPAFYYAGAIVLSDQTLPAPGGGSGGSGDPVSIKDAQGNTLETIQPGGTYVVPSITSIEGGDLAAGNEQYTPANGQIIGEPL